MPAKYQIKRSKNKNFHFHLLESHGEVILSSQMYKTKRSALNGIHSAQSNCIIEDCYERRQDKRKTSYFVLKARNHHVIGTSEPYPSRASMEKGIRSVMNNGAAKGVDDIEVKQL
jgi:hypothetical protein